MRRRSSPRQSRTSANLVYLRDKGMLFNDDRTGFVMYGVQGRTWVALGDPVGPDDATSDLIRLFLERCDDFDGVPVFYEVGTAHLHRYADFGLTFVKIGEEARVDLRAFALEGPRGARYRQAIRRLEKDGGQFEIVPAAGRAGAAARAARGVGRLAGRAGRRREGLLARLLRRRLPGEVSGGRRATSSGRIVAFANIWQRRRTGRSSRST